MCEFGASENVMSDSAIPKPLREAIRQRRIAAINLRTAILHGVSPDVFRLIDGVADLNRSIRQREWLARVTGFDPIALGM